MTASQHPPAPKRRADDFAREVTEEDLTSLIESVRTLNERLDMMNETMPAAMAIALTQAIKTTLEDPAFWDKALDQFGQAVSRRSVKVSGNFLLGLFKKVPHAIATFILVAALTYNLGGWQFMTNVLKGWFTIRQSAP